MVRLIALQTFNQDGSIRRVPNESFEASEGTARILVATGRAKRAEDTGDASQAVDKKHYSRRDMRAEK